MSKKAKRRVRNSAFRFIAGLLIIGTALCIILFSNKNIVKADGEAAAPRERCYETITIKSGDSLWSIASEYRTGEYKDNNEYIEDLMFVNNLDSEEITAGQSLIIIRYR